MHNLPTKQTLQPQRLMEEPGACELREWLSIEELTMDCDVPFPARSQHDSALQMHCRGQEMFILNHQLCPSQQHVAAGTPAVSPRFSRLGMLMGPL